jgi:hypothetical protein
MAVTLAASQIRIVTNQAWFVFSISPNTVDTSCLSIQGLYGCAVLYSGEGSKTIAYLQSMLANWPRATIQLDVPVVVPPRVMTPASDSLNEGAVEGPQLQAGSNFITVTLDDVEALRQSFIARWGDVVKPDVYAIHGA